MARQVCGTCHWCGEVEENGVRRQRCELDPRSQYLGLIRELDPMLREAFLELMSTPVSMSWGCQGWERRSPPDAPPRRTEGL